MIEELHCYSIKGPVEKTTFECSNNHPRPQPLDVLMGNSKKNK